MEIDLSNKRPNGKWELQVSSPTLESFRTLLIKDFPNWKKIELVEKKRSTEIYSLTSALGLLDNYRIVKKARQPWRLECFFEG